MDIISINCLHEKTKYRVKKQITHFKQNGVVYGAFSLLIILFSRNEN